MARRYFVSDITSDLGGGDDFSLALLPNIQGGATTVTTSLDPNETRVSRVYTPPFHPSVGGSISDYVATVEITTGDDRCEFSMVAHRVNSAGAVQATSDATAEQTAVVGTQTHTFTNLSLGTWELGDRLRLDYQFRNDFGHGGERIIVILINTTDLALDIANWRGRKSRTT